VSGSHAVGNLVRGVLGVGVPDHVFRFREIEADPEEPAEARIARLRTEGRAALARRGRSPRLSVLLTGATGFLGKEIVVQAASDPRIEEVVCVVRPEVVRHRRTGRALRVLDPPERGTRLLRRLGVTRRPARKFRFLAGDVERRNLGLPRTEIRRLERTVTHVVHCAASVAFDDTYERSFRANVIGSRNALDLSLRLQRAPASPFVAHVAIETSYVHGRARRGQALEGRLEFPPHFYNNHYELTKAMATLETDRAVLERGLRVVQILPSIVIGNSRTGNNRGDTKVVNAPVNAFGRIKESLDGLPRGWGDRARKLLVRAVATGFPADRSAELNLVPVDRVAAGVLAALTTPEAIGARIHLATDHRIRSDEMARVIRQEVGIAVRRSDPTLTRVVLLPATVSVLCLLGERKLALALQRLGSIFGVYSEWGQPVHEVGADVSLLRLPGHRPDSVHVFRMICRYNRYVLRFGRVRQQAEIARRERLWEEVIDQLEFETGREAATIPAPSFQAALAARLDLVRFRPLAAAR
jgi:nucleoside-diphosphate-sugar epimerase